jgi:hypothetical protein
MFTSRVQRSVVRFDLLSISNMFIISGRNVLSIRLLSNEVYAGSSGNSQDPKVFIA